VCICFHHAMLDGVEDFIAFTCSYWNGLAFCLNLHFLVNSWGFFEVLQH
jgi:hypothetical protein